MSEHPEAVITARHKLPAIWIVPIIALLLGAWMVLNHYLTRGPEVSITFSTAEGIEAEKTKIKALNVDVGLVESVQLNSNLEGVTVIARIEREAASLLREDSSFWVVRPRIGASGITGLNTLLSGAYIELAPGKGKEGKRYFLGLEEAPVTPMTTPGLHLTLISDDAGSVNTGDPVLYRGYRVGRIENTKFDTVSQKLHANIFIESPYDNLVNSNTRFWNSSGISFNATASGVSLQTSSIESLLLGGVAFDLPKGANPGNSVDNYEQFKLYPDANSINEHPFRHYIEYLLLFDSSVRGLVAGAPVLYRGLQIGAVVDASFNYLHIDMARTEGRAVDIPVLIRLEPGRWLGEDTTQAKAKAIADIQKSVISGMRATLKTGSLLTGALLVSLDFYEDVEPASIGKAGKYNTIPTISTGLEEIQVKVTDLLDKLNELPLTTVLNDMDVTLQQVGHTLTAANKTVKDLNSLIESNDTQDLPKTINTTLDELKLTLKGLSPDSDLYQDLSDSVIQLNATLRNIEQLTYTIDTRPNSLFFSKPKQEDLQPKNE